MRGVYIPNLELLLEKIRVSCLTAPLLFAAIGFPVFLFLNKPAFLPPDPKGKSWQLSPSESLGVRPWNLHLEGTSTVLAVGISFRPWSSVSLTSFIQRP